MIRKSCVAHQLLDEGDAARIAQVDAEILAAREIRDRVERPGVSQVFEAFAVDERVVHALDEVVYVLERPVGLAFGDDALHGRRTDALHRREAEAHIPGGVGREGPHRLVDVGSHDADAHALALVHVERQLLDVREVSAQHGSHVLRRVVGLEVGRLVSHPRVARGVRLVERVLLSQMEKQFVTEFDRLNGYFQQTFVRLFGGGQAELKLTDPNDPLCCGIEVVAQPPGKKLQLLSLLSGGERALTAIAILFAMLKVKPSPFCILDEIEAALDDANISYFADYLVEFAKTTQFVVVTHRKGTMERCDSLYGVAMEEKGVSSMVSVNLENYH